MVKTDFLLVLAIFLILTEAISADDQTDRYFKLDTKRVANVSHLVLVRDAGSFHLEKGRLYFSQPENGRVYAAVFLGKGGFEAAPPVDIEREQVRRAIGADVIRKGFDRAFFFFTDSTRQELERHLDFVESEIPSEAFDELKYGLEFTGDYEFYFSFLNPDISSFFYGHLTEASAGLWKSNVADDVFFQITPLESEQVQILRRVKRVGQDHFKDVISQFHLRDYYAVPTYLRPEFMDYYAVQGCAVDMKFADNLDMQAACQLEIRPFRPGIRHIGLYLDPEIHVDSVFCGGVALEYFDREGSVWVGTDSLFRVGQSAKIELYYHGKTIERIYDYLFVRNSWYPVVPNLALSKAQFDLKFEIPSQYRMVSVGDKISETKSKSVRKYHWKTTEPLYSASINLGFLKEYTIEDERIPPLVIMMSEVGYKSGAHMDKQVGADIANSLAFFQGILGPCNAKRLYVSEIPYRHGVAYPGLINLSSYTFESTGQSGWDEVFRSHEVAHQWWGQGGVQPATYHDRWLAEGMAEYFGLWYMQSILQDNDKFFDFLKRYRERILTNRTSMFEKLIGDDQQAGPIWMGRRTAGAKTEGDYGLIVYEKGAWVLHMVRTLMLDLTTMREDRFKAMMQEFYQTFNGQKATTHDFQMVVQKHVGIEMTWFFDQWVYGTEIPKYIFSYQTQPTAEGKFKVRCRVVQENTSKDFQMFVPIHIDFGDNRYVALRALVKGPLSEFDLPLLPLEPRKVTFNPLESVLCEVKETRWKEKE